LRVYESLAKKVLFVQNKSAKNHICTKNILWPKKTFLHEKIFFGRKNHFCTKKLFFDRMNLWPKKSFLCKTNVQKIVFVQKKFLLRKNIFWPKTSLAEFWANKVNYRCTSPTHINQKQNFQCPKMFNRKTFIRKIYFISKL